MKITSSLPDDIPRMVIRYKLKYGKLLVFISIVQARIIDTGDSYYPVTITVLLMFIFFLLSVLL